MWPSSCGPIFSPFIGLKYLNGPEVSPGDYVFYYTGSSSVNKDRCRIPYSTHRVVVIVETVDAYERMASPLLNRFEKQVSSIASGSYAHFLEYTEDCV